MNYTKETLQAKVDEIGPWHYCHKFPFGIVTGTSAPDGMQEKIAALLEVGEFSRPVYSKVLDLGANSGLISMWFANHKHSQVTAIERGPKYYPQLELAVEVKGYQDRIFPINADIVEHDLGDTEYDLVLFLGTLHHIKPEFHKQVLHKCLKALLPGGEIIVQTKSELPVLEMLQEVGFVLTRKVLDMPNYNRSAWFGMRDAMKVWVNDL